MFVKRFEQLNKDLFEECGGKAAHLGELTHLKLNVPGGFSVLGHAYYHHLAVNGLKDRIDAAAATINFDDFQDLEDKTAPIRELIIAAPVPPEIEQEVIENYAMLSRDGVEPFVAIRSSVAIKDSAVSSFPGMMDTFHYIRGAKNVVQKVKECWASVWSGRAAFARHSKGLDHNKAIIAPTVQLMVNSEMAGVLFTINPISGSKDEIVVEANWGLGETVVCGRCQSDLYVMTKKPVTIKDKRVAKKHETYRQAEGGGAEWAEITGEKVSRPTLTDAQIEELCQIACRIEDHYGCCQDIEWAFEDNNLYILQARRAKAGGE
ncbi:MAG: PEP/pyruvate-binding domain-containing protein [Syntrophorhabdales bacterium]|jgi:pyruvate,water dikinase